MDVLCFEHGGVRCAVPRAQVLEAAASPSGESVQLWAPRMMRRPDRWLAVRGEDGRDVWLGCSEPVLRALPTPEAHPLSPLLRTLLGRHLVGWADVDGELVWLVDLTRFRAG